jgi:TonB family protein
MGRQALVGHASIPSMSQQRRHFACLFFLLALSGAEVARSQNSEDSLRERFVKSREQSEMKIKGGAGFVMRANFRVWVKKDVWSTGKYLYIWTPEGKWKEEIVLPGYGRKRSGDGSQFWQIRSSAIENPAVEELERLLGSSRAPKPSDDDQFEKMKLKRNAATNVECIRLSAHPPFGWTYCFDSVSNDLLQVNSGHNTNEIEWRMEWQTQSDFREWTGKKVPFLLHGYNGDRLILEMQIQEIKPLPSLPSDFFANPNDATFWADCSEGAVWKLKNRIQPEYPPLARAAHRQGTVILRAIIEEDGHLSHLEAIHSPFPELYQSALSAVSQWRYERTNKCQGSSGRTETFIDVVYSLNL